MYDLNPTNPQRLMGRGLEIGFAAGLAAVVACAAGLWPLVRSWHPASSMTVGSPWWPPLVWGGTALGVLVAAFVVARGVGWCFERRDAAVAVVVALPGAIGGLNLGPLDPFDAMFAVVFLYGAAAVLVEHRPFRMPLLLVAAMLGLTFGAVGSVLNGGVPSLLGLHTLVSKYVLVILLVNLITTWGTLELCLKTLVVSAVVSAAVAVASVAAFRFTGYAFTFDDLEEFHYKSTPFGLMLRATALTPAPQALGHLLILALAVVLLMPMREVWRWPLAGLLLAGCASTFSSGVYLSSALVTGLAIYFRFPRYALHLTALIGGGLVAAYLSGFLHLLYEELAVPTGGDGLNDRLEYSRVALRVIQENPWFGIGVKNFGRALYIPPHNAFLQMAAETGLASALLFVALVVGLCFAAVLAAVAERHPVRRAYLAALAVGVLGMAGHFMLEPLYNSGVSWAWMGLVACGVLISRGDGGGGEEQP